MCCHSYSRWVNFRLPKPGVIVDCIDGVIDADKLDYLIRDSVNCRVRYGQALDVPRFLRALTVSVPQTGRPQARAYLTIRAKGRASAEAFAFARYELFNALYWHHTYRAIKGMILDAASRPPQLPVRKTKQKAQNSMPFMKDAVIQDLYYYFVIRSLTWKEAVERATSIRLNVRALADLPIPRVQEERALEFLWHIGGAETRSLITCVADRQVYRRIFELQVDKIPEKGRMAMGEMLGPGKRRDYTEKVRLGLMNTLDTRAQSVAGSNLTMKADRVLESLSELRNDNSSVVLDCPLRGWTPSGGAPYQISDYKRKYFVPTTSVEDRPNVLWDEVLPDLMRTIATFRVNCRRELASLVYQLLGAEQVQDVIRSALPRFFPDE